MPQSPHLRVLVLDGDQAAALAIVRSLGHRGISVEVASAGEKSLASHSRFAQRHHRYPNPLQDANGFAAWLAHLQGTVSYDFIIPVTERTIVPIARHHDQLDLRRIAIAPLDALEQVLDKSKTISLAQSLGIPSPRSILIHSLEELNALTDFPNYPIVVKPIRSVGQDGAQRVQLSVSYAFSDTELKAQVRHALRFGEVLLQEYFRGEGVGIELIADHGKIRYAFQHRRLHEVPLTGGGSSLRISEPIAPALLEASKRLIQSLGWHGVAMVEFKYAPATGEYRLIEINGRFWGSLPLAIAAGADFPAMLIDLYSRSDIGNPSPARIGTVCRNLRRDIDWLEHVLRKAAPQHLVHLPSKAEMLKDLLLIFSPRHFFDVQSLSDPTPGLIDIGQIAYHYWQRIVSLARKRQRLRHEIMAAGTSGLQRMAQAYRVLFICYGNINRSTLAHAYANTSHTGRAEFSSAGFHPIGNRPADPAMQEIAGQHGIDLGSWQSRVLTPEKVEEADIILVMETAHLDRLNAQFPASRGKSYLLGALTAAKPTDAEIADPFGKSPAIYADVCEKVLRSVDRWLEKS